MLARDKRYDLLIPFKVMLSFIRQNFIMLNVNMLNVIMLNVITLFIIILNFVMLSVVRSNTIMLNVIVLSVAVELLFQILHLKLVPDYAFFLERDEKTRPMFQLETKKKRIQYI